PDQGKAMVYVIQEAGVVVCIGGCITYRVGVDGVWLAANRGKSYSYFSVDQGDHNLCVSVQPGRITNIKQATAASFGAEGGKAYFFRVWKREHHDYHAEELEVEEVDSAKGSLLIGSTPLSFSKQRK